MVATLALDETNGATPGQATTQNITVRRYNYGRTDEPSIVPGDTTHVVIPSAGTAYSMEKWQRIRVVSMDTSVLLDNFRWWHHTGALKAGETLHTNLEEGTEHEDAYATPVNTLSAVATRTMGGPGFEPAQNLYRGGVDFFNAVDQLSNYIVWQARIAAGTAPGAVNPKVFRLHYDEQ